MEQETQQDNLSHQIPESFWRDTTEETILEACHTAISFVPAFLEQFGQALELHDVDLSDQKTEDAVFAMYLEAKIEDFDRVTQLAILLALDLRIAKESVFSLSYSRSISTDEIIQLIHFERNGYDPQHYLTEILLEANQIELSMANQVQETVPDQSTISKLLARIRK